MADAQTLGDLTLPATEPYRVQGVGATYYEPVASVGADGKPTVILSYRMAARGEIIELTEDQARRLCDLNAVKPAEEPRDYDEMGDAELRSLAASRGVVVVSSSADPEQPIRSDYLSALRSYDTGSDASMVGVATVPGGVITTNPGATLTTDGGDGFDARGKSDAELRDWLESENPTAPEVVAAANDDPGAAQALLDAESTVRKGDARSTVSGPLEKIAKQ
jgi:hypothetical protein